MSDKIYITGIGIISALGCSTDETLDALIQGKSGIEPIKYLETKHKGILPAGEVKFTNQELAAKLKLDSIKTFSRTALLGMVAAQQAWRPSATASGRTGLISSTSVGGIDKSEIAYKKYLENHEVKGLLHQMISHDCGDSTERIADYLKINGFISTISTACSSSSNAMILGARMIQGGQLDKVLVGGTDALTIYTLNGFNTLKILDEAWCRPFDQSRSGLNLGEGAAYLTLESERSVRENGSDILCELRGFGNTNDAFHQTASSPDGAGAFNAMKMALKKGNLNTTDIDYINAHGTATPNNDLSEGLAMKNLFKDYVPRFSSTKSFTGHTLAAAGSIEAVLSVLMMKNRIMAPNLNFTNPIEELSLTPITQLQQNVNINTVLSNSFGFGGNCSTLIFSKSA